MRAEPFNTLVVEFARKVGASAIVKGLRAISDFEYELEMHQLNRRQDPEIESVYLMASSQYSFLSSSGVKELATFGGRIDDLVPRRSGRAVAGRAETLTNWTGKLPHGAWGRGTSVPACMTTTSRAAAVVDAKCANGDSV